MVHECPECIFVENKESIFVSPQDRAGAKKKPTFIGKFTMKGWVGHSGFYLFRCKNCGTASVDYPHGYTNFGLIFLRCSNCGENLPLEVCEERGIYEREKAYIPPPTQKERREEFVKAIEGIEGAENKIVIVLDKERREGVFKEITWIEILN